MGIRVQPQEIKIPPKDPFQNDLLDRKESVEVLTNLIGSIEGPCVLGVDAAWGNGKTTFLGMLYQHLANEEFPVATFNAWTSDYSSDPFVAISTELTDAIRAHMDGSSKEMLDNAEKLTKDVLKHVVPGLARSLFAQVPVVGQIAADMLDSAFASYADARLSAYNDAKSAVEAFQDSLGEMARAVSEARENRPLVLLIDELDRCRPSYAVELLEVAKHLFSVDGIVFVLAVNRGELAHSVQAVYGGGFDALGYLDRFFDVDYRLPEPDRSGFIEASIRSVGIPGYVQRTRDRDRATEIPTIQTIFGNFFGGASISLRSAARTIHHLGLVYAALADDRKMLADASAVLLILRTFDRDLYYRFIAGRASDLEAVDSLYGQMGVGAIQTNEHAVCLFDAWIILAHRSFKKDAQITGDAADSPLEERYKAIVARTVPGANPPQNDEVERANGVLTIVRAITRESGFVRGIPFRTIVERIELVSPELRERVPDA